MFVGTLHADLAEQWKRQAVLGVAKIFDLCIRSRLLLPEVVRGECQDLKALLPILFIYLFEVGILRRIAAEAGRVDQQQSLAAELAQGNRLPIDIVSVKSYTMGVCAAMSTVPSCVACAGLGSSRSLDPTPAIKPIAASAHPNT